MPIILGYSLLEWMFAGAVGGALWYGTDTLINDGGSAAQNAGQGIQAAGSGILQGALGIAGVIVVLHLMRSK